MTGNRKPEAAAPAVGGSQPSGRSATTTAQAALVSLLEMALGAPGAVQDVIAHALLLAGRDELPATGPELVAFVRAHLLTPLSDAIGPRLTIALVDDLVAQIDPGAAAVAQDPSVPPSSMPRPVARAARAAGPASAPRVRSRLAVLLVDPDRVGRTTLARALLRAGWEVTVVDSTADLATAYDGGETLDVALVDAAHPAADAMLEWLARSHPELVVVARSADAIGTRAVLAQLGIERFDVRTHDAPAEELIDAIKKV